MMFQKVAAFVVVIAGLHLSFIGLAKRTTCKIADWNMTLDIGKCWVNLNNCDVYWCCDETERYGDLLKYKCVHTVLRLYPDLTRECRRQKCIPEFTWDDSYLTEAPHETGPNITTNPMIENITAGLLSDEDDDITVTTESVQTITEPGQTVTEPGQTVTEPVQTVIQPMQTVKEPMQTVTEPISSENELM